MTYTNMMIKSICFTFVGVFFTACTICLAQVQAIEQRFVVAADGSGDFSTIQEAVNAVRDYSQTPAVITVKRGTYAEKLVNIPFHN